MNPLEILFYNLASELGRHFHIYWIKVHALNDNLISGYGFVKRRDIQIWVEDFLNLRVSLHPKSYEIDCSNESLYAQICNTFQQVVYKPYKLFEEFFFDLIPDREMEGKL